MNAFEKSLKTLTLAQLHRLEAKYEYTSRRQRTKLFNNNWRTLQKEMDARYEAKNAKARAGELIRKYGKTACRWLAVELAKRAAK